MPHVACLIRKSDGKHTNEGGLTFQEIDDEMCKHFGVNPDPEHWYSGWYGHHVFLVACGRTLPEIINNLKELKVEPKYQADIQRKIAIGEWLMENFTTDAWRESKR